MGNIGCAQTATEILRSLVTKLEDNRNGLEEVRSIARRIRSVIDCNRNTEVAKAPECPVNCIADDVDRQHWIIADIIDELNQIGQIVGY